MMGNDRFEVSRLQTKITTTVALITLFLTIVAIVAAVWFGPEEIPFTDFSADFIVQLLTVAFLVSLFIERTTEVILNAWRGGKGAKLQRQYLRAKQLHRAAGKSVNQIAGEDDVQLALSNRNDHSIVNNRLALLLGLILGVIISALGVRLVVPLLDARVIDELSSGHHRLLIGLDVLITGALLGGGANGLHKILDLFLKHVDKKRESLRNQDGNNG